MALRLLAAVTALIAVGSWAPQDADPPSKYKGTASCKLCHNKDEHGNQMKAWEEEKHAQAFAALASEAAIALAKEKCIDDPQKAPECLTCHTTAYGVDSKFLDKKFTPENVQCEACHGPGEQHIKNRIKEASKKPVFARGGLSAEILTPTEETCKQCHNEKSPNFKGFDYEEMVKKVRHLDPTRKDP